MRPARVVRMVFLFFLALSAVPAHAQQTGAITGKVVDTSGGVLPGVTVEARSDVLPTPRTTSPERTASTACRRCRRAPTR